MCHLAILGFSQAAPRLLNRELMLTQLVLDASHSLLDLAEFLQFLLTQLVSLIDRSCQLICTSLDHFDLLLSHQDTNDCKQLGHLLLLNYARFNLSLVVTETLDLYFFVALLFQKLCDLPQLCFKDCFLLIESLILLFVLI